MTVKFVFEGYAETRWLAHLMGDSGAPASKKPPEPTEPAPAA
jgi:hypothetical protein